MNHYQKYKDTIYDFSDTSKYKGMWKAILIITSGADVSGNPAESLIVCGQLRRMQEFMQCSECKDHFGEYLFNEPPEDEAHRIDGLFYWAVRFLNAVSERIGHALYDIRILYPMFHTPGFMVCEAQCKGTAMSQSNNRNHVTTTRRNNK